MASQNTGNNLIHTRVPKASAPSSNDSKAVTKRLQHELRTLMGCSVNIFEEKENKPKTMSLNVSSEPGISAFPDGDNLFKWIGTIEGGKGTVYEGLQYKLTLEFPSGYPYKAVTVKFSTPCYHPNVDHKGNICLDILNSKWSALYDIRTVLLSIQSLLAEPNVKSPLNIHAAQLWKNQEAYKKHLHEKYQQDVRSKQL